MANSPDNPEPCFVTCPCQHCNGSIEFEAGEFHEDETRTVECPHCQMETVVFVPPVAHPQQPPPIPHRKGRYRLWIVLAGAGAAALTIALIVHANRVSPYHDGYNTGIYFAEQSSDDVSVSRLVELSRSITNLNFKSVAARLKWEEGFSNGFAEGRLTKRATAYYQAGMSAGQNWRVSGNLKPTDAELDAMAFQAIGTGVPERATWKSGFEMGWMQAGTQ